MIRLRKQFLKYRYENGMHYYHYEENLKKGIFITFIGGCSFLIFNFFLGICRNDLREIAVRVFDHLKPFQEKLLLQKIVN